MNLLIVFSILLFSISNYSYGQETICVTTGFGFPEMINIGLRYGISNKTEIGVELGTFSENLPYTQDSHTSLSANLLYHLRKPIDTNNSAYDLSNWYLRFSLMHIVSKSKTIFQAYTLFNIQFGREINFSKKFGCYLGAGGYLIIKEVENYPNKPLDIDLSPISFAFGLFYRF